MTIYTDFLTLNFRLRLRVTLDSGGRREGETHYVHASISLTRLSQTEIDVSDDATKAVLVKLS